MYRKYNICVDRYNSLSHTHSMTKEELKTAGEIMDTLESRGITLCETADTLNGIKYVPMKNQKKMILHILAGVEKIGNFEDKKRVLDEISEIIGE